MLSKRWYCYPYVTPPLFHRMWAGHQLWAFQPSASSVTCCKELDPTAFQGRFHKQLHIIYPTITDQI